MALLFEIPKVLFNILIFIVIQSLFFYFISAGFANNIIEDKVSRISDIFYKQLERPQKEVLLQKLKKDKQEIEGDVKKDKVTRDKKNQIFLLYRMGIPAVITLGLFIISLLGLGFTALTTSMWAYIFMMFAYFTEAGVFGILMNRYEYIGTFEILDIINDKLPEIEVSKIEVPSAN